MPANATAETAAAFEPEPYLDPCAALLGLRIDPAWIEPVSANLRVLAAAAELVAGFPLPDEAETAPRFEA